MKALETNPYELAKKAVAKKDVHNLLIHAKEMKNQHDGRLWAILQPSDAASWKRYPRNDDLASAKMRSAMVWDAVGRRVLRFFRSMEKGALLIRGKV